FFFFFLVWGGFWCFLMFIVECRKKKNIRGEGQEVKRENKGGGVVFCNEVWRMCVEYEQENTEQ
ncbi:hypothetical protein ACNIU2_26565, partial [Escherichia coli]